jgi:hypothetical protein
MMDQSNSMDRGRWGSNNSRSSSNSGPATSTSYDAMPSPSGPLNTHPPMSKKRRLEDDQEPNTGNGVVIIYINTFMACLLLYVLFYLISMYLFSFLILFFYFCSEKIKMVMQTLHLSLLPAPRTLTLLTCY